jgi:hypothetical protein
MLPTRTKAPVEEAPLPGAEFLARKIERRRLFRTTGNAIFFATVAGAAGAITWSSLLADPVGAATCCSSSCCGPSPCCGTGCCGYNCCLGSIQNNHACSNQKTGCLGDSKTNTYRTDGNASCWSCGSVTCCDCQIVDHNGCAGPYLHCICQY